MKRYLLPFVILPMLFEVASATPVYDNGVFNGLGGNAMSDLLQADDFRLNSVSTLEGIRFWALEASGAFVGSLTWSVNTDAAGRPSGTNIGSANVVPTRTLVGTALGLSVFQYDIAINLPNVTAGTYWLLLHNGANAQTAFQDFYWAWTDLNGTNTSTNRGREFSLDPPGTTWDTNGEEHAFLISGTPEVTPVPEPGTIFLISGGGLIALRFLRRKPARSVGERTMRHFLMHTVVVLAAANLALAQEAPPVVMMPIHFDSSSDLITMALSTPARGHLLMPRYILHKHGPLLEDVESEAMAGVSTPPSVSLHQDSLRDKPPFAATAGVNFEGLGTGTPGFTISGAPSDTTLAVGLNHVVQWVNVQLAIYDKTGQPLLPPPGFINGNVLWSGFGGLCQSTNRGDVLVAYDQAADRWIFSQFAFNVNASGDPIVPYLQCFAISQTSNPAGPYFRYAYDFSAAGPGGIPEFNDYAKIGVWPDAYYVTYNAFQGSPAGSNNGVIPCAYDRAAMLAGVAATSMCAPVAFYAGGAAFLPSDLAGATAPPPGTPNFMMRYSFGGVSLRIIKFKVNSFSPPSFTFDDGLGGAFGSFVNIPVGPTTVACNGNAGACIPQPGTSTVLDTLADRLMYRLGYRNRGNTESLVVTQSVDPDGAGSQQSALRWYEVRNPSGNPPTLFQNATFNPDSTNRWMGSIAMDKNGNLALGYSVSSGTVFPGIRITGRLRSEVRNQMQAEAVIIGGTGSQTGGLDRWGDYSTMRVDPADDCTFWYTTEYIAQNGSFNWRTRIASFKFPNCTP